MSDEVRPFAEFQQEGLLWLVNASVFHPRGYALAFHHDSDGNVTGWSLEGDGSERWRYDEDMGSAGRTMSRHLDVLFDKSKDLMP